VELKKRKSNEEALTGKGNATPKNWTGKSFLAGKRKGEIREVICDRETRVGGSYITGKRKETLKEMFKGLQVIGVEDKWK